MKMPVSKIQKLLSLKMRTIALTAAHRKSMTISKMWPMRLTPRSSRCLRGSPGVGSKSRRCAGAGPTLSTPSHRSLAPAASSRLASQRYQPSVKRPWLSKQKAAGSREKEMKHSATPKVETNAPRFKVQIQAKTSDPLQTLERKRWPKPCKL